MENIKDIPYDELEERWTAMLHKFAKWNIPGMEYEDILQELRIVLFNAQKSFKPKGRAAFITFLYRACLNKVRKLEHKTKAKKRIPPNVLIPICRGDHSGGGFCEMCGGVPYLRDNTEVLDLLGTASPEAQIIALKALHGETSKEDWKAEGLTSGQIEQGIRELKELLPAIDAETGVIRLREE